ncbi:putative isoamyl alcohol protein [Phaeoacremonium minimum UCRPA7]|uniref:Putative isoamyl alcohol protein n=1 Tax=Phaeoacremonium minimum (strain UCR-PA7) TaxID=1286976 RepID=R8BPP0_PHAM7|nr:putative isoamyl alcohol protein [Phaeoacremonium minimum UCRPA7]EOO01312.1 putative isoamyl alcohol protein [Phaeoacremonium minimum UCRPA7]
MTWADPFYTGSTVKVEAGVLGFEVLEAAHARDLVVLTGACPTVGVAGGYTQGGGHSALSTTFGLAADQTLEFEIVTATGQFVKASRTENADLHWALSGGGGGTYGVVISLTVRTHHESTVGGASLQMTAGVMINYYVNNAIFVIHPVIVYNSTAAYVRDTVLAPFIVHLAELGITASVNYTELPYRDHYDTYMGPLPYGHLPVEAYQYGSRMIPRSVLENNNSTLQTVLQNLTANGVLAVGSSASFVGAKDVYNAVNPAWRNTTVHMQLTTP